MRRRVTVFALIVGALTLAFVGASAAKNDPPGSSGTVVACFHQEISRYTARNHPSHCTFAGDRGNELLMLPVSQLAWEHWGEAQATATGVARAGQKVVVTAFRRVGCPGEDRDFYSEVHLRVAGSRALTLGLLHCKGSPSLLN